MLKNEIMILLEKNVNLICVKSFQQPNFMKPLLTSIARAVAPPAQFSVSLNLWSQVIYCT